jgi:hypothetical protein
MLNPDYKDMLSALYEEKVEFLIVGAYAMAAYGLPRATGDIDLFVGTETVNSRKVYKALQRFGAPLTEIQPDTFTQPGIFFQIGIPPRRIDLLTTIDGVSFKEAWAHRIATYVEGMELQVISMDDLMRNKEAAGRPKDKLDLDWLKEQRRKDEEKN